MPFQPTQYTPGNVERIPADTTPCNRHFRIALVYKNFGHTPSSHIGLGVTALNSAKYLRAKGIYTDVWGVTSIGGLQEKIRQARNEPPNIHPITHIVISAPWLPSADLQDIAINNSSIEFAVVSHSNVGFLAADPRAFKLIREYLDVETQTPNFHMAGNSDRLAKWISNTYNDPCWTLPNLYYLDASAVHMRPPFSGDTVRIGCFGAQRLLKNILSAGAAALELAGGMRIDLEFFINSKRVEGLPPASTVTSLREMFSGLRWAKLVEQPWETWPKFRQTARHMDLLMQPSFTESFNVVTADGVAEGVASVTGNAITWVPQSWIAKVDDVSDIAQVGQRLLLNPRAPKDGLDALTTHNTEGFRCWHDYLHATTPIPLNRLVVSIPFRR